MVCCGSTLYLCDGCTGETPVSPNPNIQPLLGQDLPSDEEDAKRRMSGVGRNAVESRGGGWRMGSRQHETQPVTNLAGVLQVSNAKRVGLIATIAAGQKASGVPTRKRRPATAGPKQLKGALMSAKSTRSDATASTNPLQRKSFHQRAQSALAKRSGGEGGAAEASEIARRKAKLRCKNDTVRVPFRDAGYLNPPSPELTAIRSVSEAQGEPGPGYYPDPFLHNPGHSPNAVSTAERQRERCPN